MMRENTKHTSCITKTTNRITLSNLRYSQNVFISRSTIRSEICTRSTDLYRLNDSFILVRFLVAIWALLDVLTQQNKIWTQINSLRLLIVRLKHVGQYWNNFWFLYCIVDRYGMIRFRSSGLEQPYLNLNGFLRDNSGCCS